MARLLGSPHSRSGPALCAESLLLCVALRPSSSPLPLPPSAVPLGESLQSRAERREQWGQSTQHRARQRRCTRSEKTHPRRRRICSARRSQLLPLCRRVDLVHPASRARVRCCCCCCVPSLPCPPPHAPPALSVPFLTAIVEASGVSLRSAEPARLDLEPRPVWLCLATAAPHSRRAALCVLIAEAYPQAPDDRARPNASEEPTTQQKQTRHTQLSHTSRPCASAALLPLPPFRDERASCDPRSSTP